jgi:hypothetical protein
MKKIFYVVVFLVACYYSYGQTGEAIFSIINDEIVEKNKFIDSNPIDNSSSVEPYLPIYWDYIDTNYGDFRVKLSKYRGYMDEPGFNVVELQVGNFTFFKLENSNGYADLSSYLPMPPRNYFSLVRLSPATSVLIFNECIFASQPSMVSIVVLHKNEAKLVFNKPLFINSITKNYYYLNMTLQSNTVEYGGTPESPVALGTPIIHTIWSEGGVLRYE